MLYPLCYINTKLQMAFVYIAITFIMMAGSANGELYVSRVTIDALPDEVLVHIMSYSTFSELVKVTQNVCKRWKRLSNDPQLWRDKEFCVDEFVTDAEVVSTLKKARSLRNVKMWRNVKPSVIRAVCNNCRQLTTLDIAPTQKIAGYLMKKLVKNCPNIKSLTIPCQLISDARKSNIWARLHLLQSLELEDESYIDHKAYLVPLADHCPQLTVLKLSESVEIFFEDLEYFINVKCKALTDIALPRFITSYGCVKYIDPLLEMCTSLTHLDLNCCRTKFDNETLMDLPWYRVFGNEEVMKLSVLARLVNLRSLVLRECSSEIVEPVIRSGALSRLETLELNECELLDNVVVTICMCCPELKELCLDGCLEITDDALREIHRLRKLHTLNLSDCDRLYGKGLKWVAQVSTLRKLYLKLRRWSPDLEENIADMTSLEFLSLHYLDNPFPFDIFPGRFVNLRVLKVAGFVDDEMIESDLQKLKEQMPDLKVEWHKC